MRAGREIPDLLQLDEFPDSAVAHTEVGEQLQGLADDQLAGTPVLQVGDHLHTNMVGWLQEIQSSLRKKSHWLVQRNRVATFLMITESTMDSSLSPSTSESLLYTLLVFCTWRRQEMKEQ